MLVELVIANLVIVESARLSPGEGLSVITGETGAGKSLLLDALDLVTGARARPGLVGRWGESASVTAVFQVGSVTRERLMSVVGFEMEDDQVILRRKVTDGGRSQAWINDLPVTLATLSQAAECLVDLHAQHEPIRLADPRIQMGLLDAYGGHRQSAEDYARVHARCLSIEEELRVLRGGGRESLRELDYLRFQAREFEELQPQIHEYQVLQEKFLALTSVDAEREVSEHLLQAIRDGEGAMLSQLSKLMRRLEGVHDQRLMAARESVAQASELLREVSHHADHLLDTGAVDPGELERISLRLDAWNALMRKHGSDEHQVLEAWTRITDRITELSGIDERIARLEQELEALAQERVDRGNALGEARRSSFARLAVDVHQHLAELGMPKAQIALLDEPESTPHALGTWRQAFQVRTNPGFPHGSIRDVASGGEAARLMLAISASLAMADGMPVIVYDEVDSGVGGRLGAVIGAKLARLAQGRSVIAVTHTPQLAAHGTTHYRVVKAQGDETTMVTVQRLSHKERLDEVADMLGGGEEACGQARKLLRHALDVGQCRSGGAANVSVH